MRISAKGEYGCVAILELAASYGNPQPVRVKAIADAHGIPPRFLVQILLQLKGAGLVSSIRGASGGYRLARPPHEISLADIIRTIDPAPSQRFDATGLAPSPAVQAIRAVWQEVQAEEQRMLEHVTLAELVRQTAHTNAPSYQI